MSYRQHIDTLIRLQNGQCHYCWEPMGGNPNDPSYPTVDHIVPQSRGGSDDIHNLVAACRGCNSAKGTMSQSQFMTHQRGRTKRTEYTPVYTGPPQGDPTYPSAQTVVYVLGALAMVAGLVMVFLLWPRDDTIYDGPPTVDAVSWPTPLPPPHHRADEPARGAQRTSSGPRGANDAARQPRQTTTPALTIAQRARMLEFVIENGGVTFPVVAPTPIPLRPKATPALTIAQRARVLKFVIENGGVTFPVVAPTPIPPTPTPMPPQRLPP